MPLMSKSSGTSSRHFAVVTPPSKASIRASASSRHFVHSPCSAIGSVYSLPNFLETLVPPNQILGSDTDCSCKRLARAARAQFAHCHIFSDKMRNHQAANAKPTQNEYKYGTMNMSCCDQEIVQLQRNVCHLCSHGCYLRAFAPLREWHSLRAAIAEQSSASPDVLLKGWRCSLASPCEASSDQTDLTRKRKRSEQLPLVQTVFISPDGKCFKGQRQVLRKIGLGSPIDDSDDHAIRLPQPRRLDRTLSTETQKRQCTATMAATSSALFFSKSKVSPFGLLEELFQGRKDPWRLLVSTIMLNRTTRCQVDVVLYKFMKKWPDASSAACADEEELANVIQPLGLNIRRAKGLVRFSQEWLRLLERKKSESSCTNNPAFGLTRDNVLGLYSCGDYAYDAYRIFVKGEIFELLTSADHALQIYIDYHRGLQKAIAVT